MNTRLQKCIQLRDKSSVDSSVVGRSYFKLSMRWKISPIVDWSKVVPSYPVHHAPSYELNFTLLAPVFMKLTFLNMSFILEMQAISPINNRLKEFKLSKNHASNGNEARKMVYRVLHIIVLLLWCNPRYWCNERNSWSTTMSFERLYTYYGTRTITQSITQHIYIALLCSSFNPPSNWPNFPSHTIIRTGPWNVFQIFNILFKFEWDLIQLP